jgi:hypothetical protein
MKKNQAYHPTCCALHFFPDFSFLNSEQEYLTKQQKASYFMVHIKQWTIPYKQVTVAQVYTLFGSQRPMLGKVWKI